jgi:hypothetical protein
MAKKCKHITVAVTERQYHEIRLLAAEFDTTVTALVAFLLNRLPDALRRANYPKYRASAPLRMPGEIQNPRAETVQPPNPF